MDEVARVVGEVADGVLKHVSDRMPGLEAWIISTLDTIFAPRLVLRYTHTHVTATASCRQMMGRKQATTR